MVFGESVLNDAVAIVLSTTLLSFNDPSVEVNQESIMAAVMMFITIFVGSMVRLPPPRHLAAIRVLAARRRPWPWPCAVMLQGWRAAGRERA